MILSEAQRRDAVLRVLKRLQGVGGYSDEDSGPRHGELFAIADAVAKGSMTIDRAAAQAFAHTATEMLSEHEAALNTSDRQGRETEAQRQERLVALAASQGFSESDIYEALDPVVTIDAVVGGAVDAFDFDDSPEEQAVFAAVVDMDATDYADGRKREIVSESFAKSLPGRHYGEHAKRGVGRIVVKDVSPTFSGTSVIGQTAIAAPNSIEFVQVLPKSRILSYGPAMPLRADDLNKIQRAILHGPADGAVRPQTGTAWGGPRVFFAESVAPVTVVDIDASIDWRDRMVFCMLHRSTAADILPGNAGDVDFNDSAHNAIAFCFYSGPGGASYNDSSGDILIGASAVNGRLQIYNGHATNTERVVGFVFASPDLGEY